MAEADKAEGEDRISELPKDLLVMILGRVPTKDAVATMILSKLWLPIWRMVPTLELKDDDESKKSVWWFLNKSLQLHEAPIIDRFCVELGPRCPTDVDVGKWVAKAVDHLVDELEFKLLWSADPARLPNSLYSCESLVDLTLSHQILVDVPCSACLPSLRELDLDCVVYKDDDSLLGLLSSCPALSVLYVKRRKDDNVNKFTVRVPRLCDFWYVDFSTPGRCLVLDAPAMIQLRIYTCWGVSCTIEDMPCLLYAHIDVASYLEGRFLTCISPVLSLCLSLSDAMVGRCSTINFSRLVKLNICPCGSSDWLEPVRLLLGNAPKLNEFVVDCGYIYKPPEDQLRPWNKSSCIPACLSSQLEIFEWREYGDVLEDQEFLIYIFANSKRLKTATISLRSNLEDQELIIEELTYIPRVSTSCHLFFI